MTMDQAMAEETLRRTSSGSFSVNACAMQGAIPALGFGGVGHSGIGRHHGVDGFRVFSNPRGVFVRCDNDLIDAFYAPYGERQQGLVDAVLATSDGRKVELTSEAARRPQEDHTTDPAAQTAAAAIDDLRIRRAHLRHAADRRP